MSKLISYLTFNGNCGEAMIFYQECLGGKLEIQTIGESPMADEMPETMKERILHSCLFTNEFTLMGSDLVSGEALVNGNSSEILIEFASENEMRECFSKMMHLGTSTSPIQKTFWGALFGSLTDKYGNHWLFNFKLEQQ